jgi:hypothetical protein
MGEEREMTMEGGEYRAHDNRTRRGIYTPWREWDKNIFPYKRLSPSPSDPALRFMRSQQDGD